MAESILSSLKKFLPTRKPLPEHPMATIAEAKLLLSQMDGADAGSAIADCTNWLRSFNVHDGFSPGRRARILLLIGDTMRPHWRALAHDYLAPDDEPLEHRAGDAKLLRLMLAANQAESDAYATCFVEDAKPSRWLEQNLALVLLRWTRSLVRGAALSRMLQAPPPDGTWVKINFAYRRARAAKVDGRPVAVHGDEKYRSSVRQALIRGALIELATPDRLKPRELELIHRIATRFAAAVQLVTTPSPEFIYALDPDTDTGPVSLKRVTEQRPGQLYFDMTNCIAQMKPFFESGRAGIATSLDARFSSEFTLREGNTMVKHAISSWGSHPPERKANRIRLEGTARIAHGLEPSFALCSLFDQGGFSAESAKKDKGEVEQKAGKADIRIEFDDKKVAESITTTKVTREVAAKLLDASTSGLGLSLAPAEARWAKVGTLVCIFAESARDWVVGVIRRARPTEVALSLGVEIICHQPQVAWLRIILNERELVWQEAMTEERNFDTHFTRAILLTLPPDGPGKSGEMLLPLNRVKPGVGLELPIAQGVVRLRVRDVQNSPEDYARVRVEWVQSHAPAPADAAKEKAAAPQAAAPNANAWAIDGLDMEAHDTPDAPASTGTAAPQASTPAVAPAAPATPGELRLVDMDTPSTVSTSATPPTPAKQSAPPPAAKAPHPDQWQLVDSDAPAAAPPDPSAPAPVAAKAGTRVPESAGAAATAGQKEPEKKTTAMPEAKVPEPIKPQPTPTGQSSLDWPEIKLD